MVQVGGFTTEDGKQYTRDRVSDEVSESQSLKRFISRFNLLDCDLLCFSGWFKNTDINTEILLKSLNSSFD